MMTRRKARKAVYVLVVTDMDVMELVRDAGIEMTPEQIAEFCDRMEGWPEEYLDDVYARIQENAALFIEEQAREQDMEGLPWEEQRKAPDISCTTGGPQEVTCARCTRRKSFGSAGDAYRGGWRKLDGHTYCPSCIPHTVAS